MNLQLKKEEKGRLREFFFLEQPLATARSEAFHASDPGWHEFALGRDLLTEANRLTLFSSSINSALILYWSAIRLLVTAHRARDTSRSENNLESPRKKNRLSAEDAALAELPIEQRSVVLEALRASSGDGYLSHLPKSGRQLALDGMQRVARMLGNSLEEKSTGVLKILLIRWLRISLSIVLLMGGMWITLKMFEPTNLALNKHVTQSSIWQEGRFPVQGVVDGDRSNIGFHTKCKGRQWIKIDLGKVETISKVDVFNRADCCKERALPVHLEVSTDGHRFSSIDQQTDTFDVWHAKLKTIPARYVRLVTDDNCFHLSEIEIF